MIDTFTCLCVLILGFVLGVLGQFIEAGPLNVRTLINAGISGSALGIITYFALAPFCTKYYALHISATMFISFMRFNIVTPICNSVLKCVNLVIYTISNGRVK